MNNKDFWSTGPPTFKFKCSWELGTCFKYSFEGLGMFTDSSKPYKPLKESLKAPKPLK